MAGARVGAQDFVYEGRAHVCVSAPHVLNVFSMSKVRGATLAAGRAPRQRCRRTACIPVNAAPPTATCVHVRVRAALRRTA